MNMLLFVLVLLIGLGCIFSAFLVMYREEVKEIWKIRQHHRKKHALLIDYYREKRYSDLDHQYYRKRMAWSADPSAAIYDRGYYKAEKWMDQLRYVGIPVYVKLHDFKKPDEPNKITSAVLYNVYQSRAVNRFITGMTKISFAEMDMKTVGMLAVVAIGIGLGMFYFMGGMR